MNIQSYWNTSRQLRAVRSGALTVELEAEVLQPMDTLRTLFKRNAYLTRLATFISPEEMTKDPLFVTNASCPTWSPKHNADRDTSCAATRSSPSASAPVSIELEDGRNVLLRREGHAAASAARGHRQDAVGGGRLDPRSGHGRTGRPRQPRRHRTGDRRAQRDRADARLGLRLLAARAAALS